MGTIVGDEGGVNQIGMAPGAKWIACPGLGDNIGPFDCFQFFLAPTKLDGSEPRPDLAPHVISNSWSSAGTDYHTAIQALYAAGIFYSKSAGNTGPACSTITNPGQWSEVTAAAAFAQGDTIASFSSRGPVIHGHDYYIKPDIAAPGVNVRSSIPGDSYASMQGTSMACPHVTGAVALLISANPDLAGRIDILQMLLKQAAVPKISAQCTPFVDHPNDVWGWGILDAYDAVIAAQNVGIGSLEGSIFDTTTTDPIPDAHITFMDTVRNWKFTGFSNEVGNYLKDLPASTYDLTASHYGYLDTTISDVDVIEEMTVYQDIALTPAPVWEVSGEVVDSLSGGPLAASVKFEGTPINVFTDPATGNYSANVAQGVWWMDVKSPGHTGASREITVTQNLVEDFVLTPIENYYMHMSLDGMCGPAFNWIDATSGGDPHPLGDDANVYVGFTNGETFTFYGNTYTGLFIGSNGIVTFGSGSSAASGPIPNTTAPNNGIYGFSMDLNPASGSQGNIYTKYLDNRYFVIEWYQVQHYPSGNPETFEIILDFDTNQATIQYLTVSDPSSAVSGVENLTGTEATQYAYGEPTLIADGNAVTFYPHFGTPPPIGGTGELSGVVTDASSGQPIEGAFVLVESFSTGTVFTMTTDIVGAYTAPLCADWYDTTAEAAGYIPSEVTTITVMSGTLTTQDFTLEPCVECSNLDFSWTPTAPLLGQVITFTATASGTLPISFTWDFGDGAVGSGEVISHAFTNAGTYTVSVSANNCAGIPVTKEYLIEVQTPYRYIFLPLTIK